jgi:hypothetical protein
VLKLFEHKDKIGGVLQILNSDEKPLFFMLPNDEGDGALFSFNSKGKVLFEINSNQQRCGMLATYNGQDRKLFTITTNNSGEPGITTFARNGKPRHWWPK